MNLFDDLNDPIQDYTGNHIKPMETATWFDFKNMKENANESTERNILR